MLTSLPAIILREKLEAGEVSNADLGNAVRNLIDAAEQAPMILSEPWAWILGYLGHGGELLTRQDEAREG